MSKTLINIAINGVFNRVRGMVSAKIFSERVGRDLFVIWEEDKINCNCRIGDVFDYKGNDSLWKHTSLDKIKELFKVNPLEKRGKIEVNDKLLIVYPEINPEKGIQYYVNDIKNSNHDCVIIINNENFYDPDMGLGEFISEKQKIYNSMKLIEPIYKKLNHDLKNMSKIQLTNLNVNQDENVNLPKKYISLHLRGGDFRPPKSLNGLIPEIDQITSELLKNCNKYQIKDVYISHNDKILFRDVLNKLLGHSLNIFYITRETERTERKSYSGAIVDWLILSKSFLVIYFAFSSFGYEATIPNLLTKSVELPQKLWGEWFPIDNINSKIPKFTMQFNRKNKVALERDLYYKKLLDIEKICNGKNIITKKNILEIITSNSGFD